MIKLLTSAGFLLAPWHLLLAPQLWLLAPQLLLLALNLLLKLSTKLNDLQMNYFWAYWVYKT